MKKIYISFLLLLFVSTVMEAYDFRVDDYYYTILNDSEVAIVGNKNTSISSLEIPASVTNGTSTYTVTTVGQEAFENRGLVTVTFPHTIKSVQYNAFYGCNSLTAVYVPDITSWCNIEFPDGWYDYRANPLYYARNLYVNYVLVDSIEIPENITSISAFAFYGCENIAAVHLSENVENIGIFAFANCPNLTSIHVDAGNSHYSSVDGVLYNKDETKLIQTPAGKEGAFVVQDNVTAIEQCAFSACEKLTSIAIPAAVNSIGQRAFEDCYGLTAVHTPDILSWCSIDFNNDTAANPLHCAHDLYVGGEKTEDLVLPESITSVHAYSFYRSSIKSLDLSAAVQQIGSGAFEESAQLETVICRAMTPPEIDGSFFGISPTATLLVPQPALEAYMAIEGYTNSFAEIKVFSDVEDITETTATLKWIPDTAVTQYDINVYAGGALFAHYVVDGEGNITSSQRFAPSIYHQKMDSTTSSTDYFVISLNGLSAGTDYTYTIDGTNAESAPVYHEEGSFTTLNEEEEGVFDAIADDPNKAIKILRDGMLYIERNGMIYNLNGTEIQKINK